MKQLTEEQRKQLMKLEMKLVLKNMLNGVHNGLIAIAMNVILTMAILTLSQKFEDFVEVAGFFQFVGCVAIGIFVIRRLLRINKKNILDFKNSVEQILK